MGDEGGVRQHHGSGGSNKSTPCVVLTLVRASFQFHQSVVVGLSH